MFRTEWDFEQHVRHAEREALTRAERSRLLAAARGAAGSERRFGLVSWLWTLGNRLEAWVSGGPRPTAVPAPCRERIV